MFTHILKRIPHLILQAGWKCTKAQTAEYIFDDHGLEGQEILHCQSKSKWWHWAIAGHFQDHWDQCSRAIVTNSNSSYRLDVINLTQIYMKCQWEEQIAAIKARLPKQK